MCDQCTDDDDDDDDDDDLKKEVEVNKGKGAQDQLSEGMHMCIVHVVDNNYYPEVLSLSLS